MEGEEDVTASVTVNSDVNADQIGLYSVSLFWHGLSSSGKNHSVIVYDPEVTTDAAGDYTVIQASPSKVNGECPGSQRRFQCIRHFW